MCEGILLLNKPRGRTSFSLVSTLRKLLNVRKIGHAGTLDPFATGVMVMLIGRNYTRLSDQLLCQDKEYLAELHLGIATETYDCDGEPTTHSSIVPTLSAVEEAMHTFQGKILQYPPMYSAKKIGGKKLYHLARQGITIERPAVAVEVHMTLISYQYPFLTLKISCSKGTYIRSLAHDIGLKLECGAHLSALQRTRSGIFQLEDCLNEDAFGLAANHIFTYDAPLS